MRFTLQPLLAYTSVTLALGELAADFPTVKATLRHESADSEEDREGLGCHLGQDLGQ